MSQEQVEDKMLELCGYAGSFSNACMETVLEESDDIYKMLTEQFNEEICDLSGLCSQSFEKVPATELKERRKIFSANSAKKLSSTGLMSTLLIHPLQSLN